LVDYIFTSHLGLIRCLTLIVRVSTQHQSHTSTEKLGCIHKIIDVLPEEVRHGVNPKQSRKFVTNKLKMGSFKLGKDHRDWDMVAANFDALAQHLHGISVTSASSAHHTACLIVMSLTRRKLCTIVRLQFASTKVKQHKREA
jgi:hypothetical protein